MHTTVNRLAQPQIPFEGLVDAIIANLARRRAVRAPGAIVGVASRPGIEAVWLQATTLAPAVAEQMAREVHTFYEELRSQHARPVPDIQDITAGDAQRLVLGWMARDLDEDLFKHRMVVLRRWLNLIGRGAIMPRVEVVHA